jgi:hypothetical protein
MKSLNLAQRRAIDQSKERLVPAAEAFLDDAGVRDIPKKHFGDSQLRNLIAIANETDSPAVVMNFVRFQMGRDSHARGWRREHGGKSVGQRLLDDLSRGEGAIQSSLAAVPGLDDPLARQLATIELVRQYLGFASRYLKYLESQRPQE